MKCSYGSCKKPDDSWFQTCANSTSPCIPSFQTAQIRWLSISTRDRCLLLWHRILHYPPCSQPSKPASSSFTSSVNSHALIIYPAMSFNMLNRDCQIRIDQRSKPFVSTSFDLSLSLQIVHRIATSRSQMYSTQKLMDSGIL